MHPDTESKTSAATPTTMPIEERLKAAAEDEDRQKRALIDCMNERGRTATHHNYAMDRYASAYGSEREAWGGIVDGYHQLDKLFARREHELHEGLKLIRQDRQRLQDEAREADRAEAARRHGCGGLGAVPFILRIHG